MCSPCNLAGPDGVLLFGKHPVFCQMKFRDKCTVATSFYSTHTDSLYKDKNGQIPANHQNRVKDIHSLMADKKVVRILFCYPFIVKDPSFESHFRHLNPRQPRNGEEKWHFVDLLVDGRNAISFFGEEAVQKFDLVRDQARIFGIEDYENYEGGDGKIDMDTGY